MRPLTADSIIVCHKSQSWMTAAQWEKPSVWGQMTSDKYQLCWNVLGCVSIFWRAFHIGSWNVKLLLVCIDFGSLFKEAGSESRPDWIAPRNLYLIYSSLTDARANGQENNRGLLLPLKATWRIQYADRLLNEALSDGLHPLHKTLQKK